MHGRMFSGLFLNSEFLRLTFLRTMFLSSVSHLYSDGFSHTLSMGLLIVYFKGSQVDFSKL